MRLLSKLASMLEPAAFWATFGDKVTLLASDSYDLIRNDWVRVMAEIVDVQGASGSGFDAAQLAGFDAKWAAEKLVPIVLANSSEDKPYLLRAVVCTFTARFANLVPAVVLADTLLPAVLEMADAPKVPNLRLKAVGALRAVQEGPHDKAVLDKAKAKLLELSKDSDPDVQFAAESALA